MIPRAHLTEWSRRVPWPEINQVEQDLVLMGLDGRRIAEVFQKAYRPEGFRRDALIAALDERLERGVFDDDLAPLLPASAPKYDPKEALARVRRDVLDVLEG